MQTLQLGDHILGGLRLVWGLQGTLTLTLSGFVVLFFLIALGAVVGWVRGIRSILTVALFSVIAYLICVEGGEFLVGTINRFYQNGPRLATFALGRDPSTAPVLDPLIDPAFSIPLFFRFIFFLVLVGFGIFFNRSPKWYAPSPNVKAEPLSQVLGAFVGGFTALLWVSAFTSFWVDWVNSGGGFGGVLGSLLLALPDVTVFMPSLITIFFLLMIVIILFNLPKLWKA
jgi:hypothetical protein